MTDLSWHFAYSTPSFIPEHNISRASILSADRRERISVTVRPTDEKSRSDWAEHADMQNTRRAVVDIVGNCSALSRQNVSGLLSAAGWTCSALYWASSAALSARRAEAHAVRSWQSRSSSKGSRRGLLCCGLAVEVDCLIHNNSSVPVPSMLIKHSFIHQRAQRAYRSTQKQEHASWHGLSLSVVK